MARIPRSEEVKEEVVKEEVVKEAKVVKGIPKSRPATGRFFFEIFDKEIGVFNQAGILVGKENDIEKVKDMVSRFNFLSGIK